MEEFFQTLKSCKDIQIIHSLINSKVKINLFNLNSVNWFNFLYWEQYFWNTKKTWHKNILFIWNFNLLCSTKKYKCKYGWKIFTIC